MCTRSQSRCTSISFPVHGLPYTKVCGRAHGYQYKTGEAFQRGGNSVDGYYVDGLSVTYGSPRQHIWTFAVGVTKNLFNPGNCLCATNPGSAVPPEMVGSDYFCESGTTIILSPQWWIDDPLWDSQRCPSGSTCCDRGGPWFTTTLSQEVRDNIEMRICLDESASDENIGLDQLELYVY